MADTDPLADVLKSRAEPEWMADLGLLGDHVWEEAARAAREHIAAKIEARIDTPPMLERDSVWYDGMANAARIARGQT